MTRFERPAQAGLRSILKLSLAVSLATLWLPVVAATLVAWRLLGALAVDLERLGVPVGHPWVDMFARLRLWQVLVLAGALWVLLVACQVLAATALVAVYNRLWRPAGPQPETVAVPAPLPVASSQPAHVIGPPPAPRPVPVRPAAELVALSAPDRLGASQPSRPGLRLEITAPIPQVVPLLSQSVVIGSGPEAGLRLEGLRPRHAELVVRDGRYLLRDLGGSQTWVQGRLISGPHVVKDGFRLQLGHWQMVFRE